MLDALKKIVIMRITEIYLGCKICSYWSLLNLTVL